MRARIVVAAGLLLGMTAALAFVAARSPALGADLSWQWATMLHPPGEVGDRLQR